jgi:glutamate 5-kinase
MVTIPAPEEPQVEEQLPADEPAEETSDEEVDYRAKTAALEAQVTKLENDLRSRDGQRRRDTDRDAELAGIRDSLGALQRVFTVYVEDRKMDMSDEAQAQISRVGQELAQGQATRDWNARYEKEQSRLMSTVQDDEGNILVSEDDVVKIQSDWQAAWAEGSKAVRGDFEDVINIQVEAARMVAQEERRRGTEDRKRLSDEAKNAGKKALERAGVADLDTGAAIAGGNEELRGSALIERGLRRRNL